MKKKKNVNSKKSHHHGGRQTKKSFESFSGKSARGAKNKARRNAALTAKKQDNGAKQNKKKLQTPQEPVLGMRINGVARKIKNSRGGAKWYLIPTASLSFDIELPSQPSAHDGELCLVSLTKLPTRTSPALARVERIFGSADSKSANYEAILSSYGIETTFPLCVEQEAEKASLAPLSVGMRTDLRDELIFTIDGSDAKDLDDAVSLRRTEDGFLLGVHIADVSHYVTEGSETDREAMKRGTSVYFTDKVVPMLPRSLSNGACSLGAGEDKYALSCFIFFDNEGNACFSKIEKSIIKSLVRGVYSEVNDLYAHGTDSEFYDKYEEVYKVLSDMRELYLLRERIAAERGYVELETAEAYFLLDSDGMPTDVVKRTRGIAERLIEQFMLAANEAVARYMSAHELPCVYRVHDVPDDEKLSEFVNFAYNRGIDVTPLASSPLTAIAYSKVLEDAKSKGLAEIVSDAMLRSFMKARYSDVRADHFGLALSYYAHFTSPIRRYPDLSVHRILSRHLAGEKIRSGDRTFARLSALRSSENELRALGAERAICDLYKTIYMKRFEGEEFDAVICSVRRFGFFCTLDNTCEGLVPVSSLSGYYTYNEAMSTLVSRDRSFDVGERVRIKVKYADTVRRKVEFEFIEKLDAAPTELT